MAKKKYRLTTCNICGSQAPANFMVRHPKKITATSRNTVGGKEVVGAILGFQTSQKALERSLLTSRKRTHTTYRTVWMCEECSGKKSVGTLEKESLTREAKDLAKEGKGLANDLNYLIETKIPELESQLKYSKEKVEEKNTVYVEMLEKGVKLFENLRKEFNSIKKQNAEDFAEEVLTNAELNKLIKIYPPTSKKATATSRNTVSGKEVVGGKEIIGSLLGNEASQRALERAMLTEGEKLSLEVSVEDLAEAIDMERKKIGTRWEDKTKLYSLEAELNKKKDQLKIDEKEYKESVVNRFSDSLITKYKNKKSIIDIFNEKHADVAFSDKTKLFSLKNFKYKEESLNFNESDQIKGKINFWIGWIVIFLIILAIGLTGDVTDIFETILGYFLMFILPAGLRILYLKRKTNKSHLNIHKKFVSILKRSLEKCISELNQRINENKIEIDLQKFINFQKESDLISSEFDDLKRDLEDCEAALSEDNVLKSEIENRLQVITDRLITLKEAGITL